MLENKKQKTALVTGAAGFIGYHISQRLLDEGWRVIGVDSMSDYYDVSLKKRRESMLLGYEGYRSVHQKVENENAMLNLFSDERPNVVIHLAAQAGVRYSIENPRSYLKSNINGTFELLEAARAFPPKHMFLASTSSVYGANDKMPYKEVDKTDYQMSFYAASKKSTENMAHSYAHLYNIPITITRLFTVYGPWGRPDMALFKFTKAILNDELIDVYNGGNLKRDFTYIDDVVQAIVLLIDKAPSRTKEARQNGGEFSSPVAPFQVINIGNGKAEKLLDFIQAIEIATGISANMNFTAMQAGDVLTTFSDCSLLEKLTGFTPKTSILDGVSNFVDWYKEMDWADV